MKQRIDFGDASSGIAIAYIKRRRTLHVFGWYDHIAGIEGHDVPLGEFLAALGITEADCNSALRHTKEATP